MERVAELESTDVQFPAVPPALRPGPPGQRGPAGTFPHDGRDDLGPDRWLLRRVLDVREPGGRAARRESRRPRWPAPNSAPPSSQATPRPLDAKPRSTRSRRRTLPGLSPAKRGVAEGGNCEATASARLARWWAVRAAGGTYPILLGSSCLKPCPGSPSPRLPTSGRAPVRQAPTSASEHLGTAPPVPGAGRADSFSSIPPGRGLKYRRRPAWRRPPSG